jgi:outer membrane lipoprotein SlyB
MARKSKGKPRRDTASPDSQVTGEQTTPADSPTSGEAPVERERNDVTTNDTQAAGAAMGSIHGAFYGLAAGTLAGGPVGAAVGAVAGTAAGAAIGAGLVKATGIDEPVDRKEDKDERLRSLYERWGQLKVEYEAARDQNAQQLMTNLRGLMLIVQREIRELGGDVPEFPYSDQQRRRSG